MNWLRNIASNYLRFVVGLGVMAVMTPVIINAVGLEAYGQWAIVYAAIALVSLSDLGFATAAIKFLAEAHTEGRDRTRQITGALTVVYFALTVLCAVIVGIIHALDVMPLVDEFLLLGISACMTMASSVHRAYLVAVGRQDIVNSIMVAGSLLQALMTWLALDAGYGVFGVAAAHLIAQCLQALGFIGLAIAAQFPRPDFSAIGSVTRQVAHFSIWALIANVAFVLILRIDPILIESLLSATEVALLAIALKVGEQALLFNKQFSNALLPLVSRNQGADRHRARADILVYTTRYLMLIAVPFTGLLAINADDLLRLWIGESARPAAPVLTVLALAALVSTSQFNAANINGMSGLPRFVALVMSASAMTKIALTLSLTPGFGILVPAMATLAAALTCEALCNIVRACRLTATRLNHFVSVALAPAFFSATPGLVLAVRDAPATSLTDLLATNSLYGATALAAFAVFFLGPRDREFFNFLQKDSPTCAISTAK